MSHEELVGLVVELLAEVRGLREANERLVAENAELRVENTALRAEVVELRRRLGSDSSNSSRPPSSDSPFVKPAPKKSAMRRKSGRGPGKQPGSAGMTRGMVDDPDEIIPVVPGRCRGCGEDLSGVPDRSVRRSQVVEAVAPPPPRVTEYRIATRECPCCGTATAGDEVPFAGAPVVFGPRSRALMVFLAIGQHVPYGRTARILDLLCGLRCSPGAVVTACRLAAAALEPFMAVVRELLAASGLLHADETPVRAGAELHYLHVACNDVATAMHVGGRSAADIDAGGILPAFTGVLVRDGYAGYVHLTGALHAWCGAHLLRDLKAVHDADPGGQLGALALGDALHLMLNDTHTARTAGAESLDPDVLAHHLACYHGAIAQIREDNAARTGDLHRRALTLANRFEQHQGMILRFLHDLAVPFTNNAGEREIRGAKIRQRVGGCWRALTGLADFAVIWSYLATAAKWGIDQLDALTTLFTTGPWLPPAQETITAA
jgi:transposase